MIPCRYKIAEGSDSQLLSASGSATALSSSHHMMDWLTEDDIVHVIVDAIGVMDLRRFEEYYSTSGPGQAAFSPAMMLAVLIYADSNKLRSSRKIEQLCRRDAGFRLIARPPDGDGSVTCSGPPEWASSGLQRDSSDYRGRRDLW